METPEKREKPDMTPGSPEEKPEETAAPETEPEAEAEVEPETEGKAEVEPDVEPEPEADPDPEADSSKSTDQFRKEMAESLSETPEGDPRIGQRISGKLIKIGDKESFVDYGGRSEGVISTSELKNKDGELKHNEGDTIQTVVESVDEQVILTLGRKAGPADKEILRQRYEAKVPVEGMVKGTNKGGFEIFLGRRRAFCPFSQIDIAYCDNPDKFIGSRFSFLITRFDGGGRNIVLSRRVLLEEDRKKMAEETEARLKAGEVFDGIVRRVLPFGAFIDIGGIEGLLHVSEVSHTHVKDPSRVLTQDQEIKVQILAVEQGEKGRRISLSMKALEPDPWIDAAKQLEVGSVINGKVARLTDFGAFIEVAPGVDGLLHVSEIAFHHVKHPKEELTPGQEVEVKILDVDLEKRRVALSRKALESMQQGEEEQERKSEAPRRREKKAERPSPEAPPPAPTDSMDTLLARLQNKYEDDTLD